MSAFGAIALLLAAIGLYGIIAYGVTQRTREMGVRIAVGATSRDVVTLVMRHALGLVAFGVARGARGGRARVAARPLVVVRDECDGRSDVRRRAVPAGDRRADREPRAGVAGGARRSDRRDSR